MVNLWVLCWKFATLDTTLRQFIDQTAGNNLTSKIVVSIFYHRNLAPSCWCWGPSQVFLALQLPLSFYANHYLFNFFSSLDIAGILSSCFCFLDVWEIYEPLCKNPSCQTIRRCRWSRVTETRKSNILNFHFTWFYWRNISGMRPWPYSLQMSYQL